jgi:hypothetical protein
MRISPLRLSMPKRFGISIDNQVKRCRIPVQRGEAKLRDKFRGNNSHLEFTSFSSFFGFW